MCNMMCLYSEWDENKSRNCRVCSGNYFKLDETLSPQQTEQMEVQDKMNTGQEETQASLRIQSKYSYTKHKRIPLKKIRRVLLAEYRLSRA